MDGLIIIDKPAGFTSHDIVDRVRRILKTKRVGHTGTLDPFATGVLLICVGRATRLSQFLVGCNKNYDAVVRLGFATDTQDNTGQPITPVRASDDLPIGSLKNVLNDFLGKQKQTPPMYSAKKIGGVALHKLARKNVEVERVPVDVNVMELGLSSNDWLRRYDDGTREFAIHVKCSAGTYIRTFAHDIGQTLGYGAHLTALRRTAVSDFTLDQSSSLESLELAVKDGHIAELIVPMIRMLPDIGIISVTTDEARHLIQGRRVQCNRERMRDTQAEIVGIAVDDQLIGIARYNQVEESLVPSVIMTDAVGG